MPVPVTLSMTLVAASTILLADQARPNRIPPDLTAVTEFWRVVDTLADDRRPSEEQWRQLLTTRAYRYLVEVNRRERVLKTYLPMALMPSQLDTRERALAAGTFESKQYLAHFVEAASRREQLVSFAASLQDDDTVGRGLSRAAAFLPPGVTDHLDPPPISFAIFEPDAFGSADYGIVIDLLYATRVQLSNLIGHEAHHYYLQKRYPLRAIDRSRDDYALVHALVQLWLEGIADGTDKADVLDPSSDPPAQLDSRTRYRQWFAESASRLTQADTLIAAIADHPDLLKENGAKVWDSLPNAGHPQGYFMTSLIVKVLGRQALIDAVPSPFEFVRAYNRSASRAGAPYPVFSSATMNVLQSLEQVHAQAQP
jgi:hypothetical protein